MNVLIIGCGGQGSEADQPGSGNEHKVISFAHAFMEHPETDKIIFWDESRIKRNMAAEIWGGETAINLETIFLCCIIDIVVIATPDNTHYDILKDIANRNVKLVICEKPICTDLYQAKEIVELYKQKNIPLMINYTRRFLPYYDYLKEYGTPEYATCAFNRGLLHTGSHAVDFFNMIGVKNYRLIEVPTEEYRVWDLKVYYKDYIFSEVRTGDDPVWHYYSKTHEYVVGNAYNFLAGKEPLKCTGEQALKTLEMACSGVE